MSRRTHILGFGLLVAATAMTAPAYAQSTSASAANVAADFPACTKTSATSAEQDSARQKFIAARQDYEEGAYDSALRRFHDAYLSDCTKPEVLQMVSATYERKGDKASALAALETYMQRAPKDAPDLATTQAKIDNLKKQIAAQPPPTASTTTSTTTTAPPATEMQEHTIYPWILAGVGVAAVIAGVVVIVAAPANPGNCTSGTKTCSRKPGETDAELANDESQAGTHQGQPIVGGVIAGVGGAMVLGGLIWHFVEPTGPKEKTSGFVPSVAPGYAGLTFHTKF